MVPGIKYIRPDSVLAVCCDLLSKWLRVRVRVRVSLGQGMHCVFFVFFFSGNISVVNIFIFGGLVSARRKSYEY